MPSSMDSLRPRRSVIQEKQDGIKTKLASTLTLHTANMLHQPKSGIVRYATVYSNVPLALFDWGPRDCIIKELPEI